MTEQLDPTPNRDAPGSERLGRPPRFIVLVVLAVVLVASVWSGIWYFGTQKAEEMVTAWLATEADRGRTYDCKKRGFGGYPFRVEVTCSSPRLDIADASPRIRVSAEHFRAVAQVWNLTHVIFEIDGPVRIETGDRRKRPDVAVDATWQLMQGSVRAPGGQVESVDVAITDLTAAPDPGTVGPGGGATVTAHQFELHGRTAGSASSVGRDYEVALDARALVVALQGATPADAVDLAFVGRLDAMPHPPPRDPQVFLTAWRGNRGTIQVDRLSATQGETELRASGLLTPDETGRPEGAITIALAGPDVTTPGVAGAFGGLAPIVAMALMFTGKATDIDGRTALSGEIAFKDGKVMLGSLAIAELPRLF